MFDQLKSFVTGDERAERGQLGVFMVLVMAAIALVVVSIVLLFGIDIAGSFAQPMVSDTNHTYHTEANSTVASTGDAFELLGTSVLVIPAAGVLAVLIGGLVGAISMRGSLPGMGGGGGGGRRRR
jgi:ABC-type Fe3+ transport system permease subunit